MTLRRAPDLAIALETSEKDALNLQKSTLQGEDVAHNSDDTVRDPKGPNTFTSVIGVTGGTALLNVVFR